MKLKIVNRRVIGELTNIWKLNSTQTMGQRKKNHMKIRKKNQINDSKSTTYQNLWDTRKTVLRGNLYQLRPFSLKRMRDLNNLILYSKELEKGQ